jgi:hypothetical protein
MPLERRTVSLHALPLLGLETADTLEEGRGLNLTVEGRERAHPTTAATFGESREGRAVWTKSRIVRRSAPDSPAKSQRLRGSLPGGLDVVR